MKEVPRLTAGIDRDQHDHDPAEVRKLPGLDSSDRDANALRVFHDNLGVHLRSPSAWIA